METRLQPVGEVAARFAAMERDAGLVFGVALVSSAACVALFRLNLWFIFGSILAGSGIYLCWRATLANRVEVAGVAALAAVILGALAATTELSRSLPVFLCSGMSLLGVGLYAGILIGRTFKRTSKYEV